MKFLLAFVIFICIPITALILLVMSDFIETIYKNPEERIVQNVGAEFHTTLPSEYVSVMFVQNSLVFYDDEVRIEIVLSKEQGENYLQELKKGKQYGIYTYSKLKNGNIQISMSHFFDRGNYAPKIIKRKGNKQIGKYLLKVLLAAIVYYIIIKVLLRAIRKAKEREQELTSNNSWL